jgi:GT2 family glycosyltransferase
MPEVDPPTSNRDWLRRTRDEVRDEVAAHEALRREIHRAHDEIDQLRHERDDAINRLQAKALELDAIQRTRSWAIATRLQRVASPLRKRESAPSPAPVTRVENTVDATRPLDPAMEQAKRPGSLPHTTPTNARTPSVSVIIPTRDRPDLVRGVLATIERTSWPSLEVVFVDNGTTDEGAIAAMEQSGHVRARADAPFNFAELIAHGVSTSTGDVLILLNNDVETTDPNWVAHLVQCLEVPGCGIAGALLMDPEDRIQHCGLVINDGVPVHALSGMTLAEVPLDLIDGIQQRTAVTGACMALERDTWNRLGGMEPLFAHNFNDVDLCLRAERLNLQTLCTARTVLTHHESATRGHSWNADVAAEWLLFRARWTHRLREADPHWPARIRPADGAPVDG